MVFITWAEDGVTIRNCSWMDLIVGNMRPDWFMDSRGSMVDVQYLGDEHIYHRGVPRLVKKWRKKDFADHYFTMSMQRLPAADGVHWPLVLNIPGEGFGDDGLQHYFDHEVLSEEDEAPFLIDEAFIAAGGECPERGSSPGANETEAAGPPQGGGVPSNLHIDSAAWRSITHTESPVWTGVTEESTGGSHDAPAVSGSASENGVVLEACFDTAASALLYSLAYSTAEPAWTGMRFYDEDDDGCFMTPNGGEDGEGVIVEVGADGTHTALHGPFTPSMKRFDIDGFRAGLSLLDDVSGFQGVTAEHVLGQTSLHFARTRDEQPATVKVAYALGDSPEIGYHSIRGCLAVTQVPTCSGQGLTSPEPDCATEWICAPESPDRLLAEANLGADYTDVDAMASAGVKRISLVLLLGVVGMWIV